MKESVAARNSNIELFRILSMISVIVLHYNNISYGAGFNYVVPGSINENILYLLEFLCIGAVDSFILISGYFNSKSSKRTLIKPVKLVVQTIVIALISGFVIYCLNSEESFISSMSSYLATYWFISVYVALYLISPYLNIIIDHLNNKMLLLFVNILFFVFSVEPYLVELCNSLFQMRFTFLSFTALTGSAVGYSIFNAILMYFVGALICRYIEFIRRIPAFRFLLLFIICSLVNEVVALLSGLPLSYAHPLVILGSTSLFCFFLVSNSRGNRIINTLSRYSFSVYITHIYFLKYICVSEFVNKPVYILILHILVSCLIIYLIGWVIGLLYDCCTNKLFQRIQKRFGHLNCDIGKIMTSND